MSRVSFWRVMLHAGLVIVPSIPLALCTAIAVEEERDLDRFQGSWSLDSAQRDGKKLPQEEVQKIKLTIQGNEFVLKKESVVVSRGTFTLDPTKKPKQIDETVTGGPNQGKVYPAIYEIGDDQHTICFAAAGKERPTAFSSEPGSGHLLQVWKRDKKR